MTGRNSVRFIQDETLAHWVSSFRHLENKPLPASVVREWRAANEVFFSNTQQAAHVLSGDMKRTGSLEVELHESGILIDADLSYGGMAPSGEDVDYTIYELRRGGSHDFFARGLRQSTRILEEGVGSGIIELMRSSFE
ncbi:hypothetical protein BJD78_gp26 [Arthrobacter phage KellEzio]|uniref:Uncharacterized protein n=1 Tax=Arthrobacter phage KellEzio TaxID=1796995 RepID=A0A140G6B1_9CAUD|nr:hypothetical protein BJD78_gp26 [Arthrobacter phage KellEzio]AMM44196.1 hypothetical protein KELLEZIO_26 [Arthrobacter phage KellEzio]